VRKPKKLPAKTVSMSYALEYGTDSLEVHEDAIKPGQRVLICDDLLATGGTALATAKLIEKLGGNVEGAAFAVELTFLNGAASCRPRRFFFDSIRQVVLLFLAPLPHRFKQNNSAATEHSEISPARRRQRYHKIAALPRQLVQAVSFAAQNNSVGVE